MNIVIEVRKGTVTDVYVDESPCSDGCTVLIVDHDADEESPLIRAMEPDPWCTLIDLRESDPKLLNRILKPLGLRPVPVRKPRARKVGAA